MVEVAERIGKYGSVIGWTKGSSFGESRQKCDCGGVPAWRSIPRDAGWQTGLKNTHLKAFKRRRIGLVNNKLIFFAQHFDSEACSPKDTRNSPTIA
jgi:hypothetical protein